MAQVSFHGLLELRSIHEGIFNFFVFLIFHVLFAIMRAYHRHGDTYLYHIMSTKISPPRVTGYMPASGHWRFRGTMTPSRSKQAAPLAVWRHGRDRRCWLITTHYIFRYVKGLTRVNIDLTKESINQSTNQSINGGQKGVRALCVCRSDRPHKCGMRHAMKNIMRWTKERTGSSCLQWDRHSYTQRERETHPHHTHPLTRTA